MRVTHQVRRRPIPLTPLIDVVFLLLVFFLLASTFLREDVLTIRLAGGGATAAQEPVRVEITADGRLSVDGTQAAADGLGARVLTLAEEGRAVVVVPGEGVDLGAVVGVLDALQESGVTGVGIARVAP